MRRKKGKYRVHRLAMLWIACLCILSLAGCKSSDNTAETTESQNTAGLSSDQKQVTYNVTEEGMDFISGNAPISSYWFVEDLLEWDAAKDPDAAYNKSAVPLALRMEKDSMETINPTQNKDTRVVALTIMNRSTSGNPSQGTNSFNSNTFSYWQYVDLLVYWGGSSGEGIIVPPSSDVTDSAHTNGVPVLGTVFFPQTAHGGKMEWLNQALTKDANGDFPFAKKLVEVANEYGFDGWFINQETEGTEKEPLTKEHSILMQEFLKKIKEYGGDTLEIMWYDSQTAEGKMDWQNTLNEKNEMFIIDGDEPVADSMFLNFWWYYKDFFEKKLIEKASSHAETIGVNPYNLYAGIDVQAYGIDQPVRWYLLEKSLNSTFTSLGLYCPSWTFFSSDSFEEFQDKENKFWINEYGNPAMETNAVDMEWRGISTYITERSPIVSLPFYTDFNIGNGYNYFKNGEKISTLDWNNRSFADIMPTYRWLIENGDGNKVIASIDHSNAYNGGNSLRFLADLRAGQASKVHLYRTNLKLTESTKFTVAARADAEIAMSLLLKLEDGSIEEIKGDKELSSDWQEITYDIQSLKEQSVHQISFQFVCDADTAASIVNLGNISVYEEQEMNKIHTKSLHVDDVLFEEDDTIAGVRLSWEADDANNLKRYEIYRVNADESRSFLGASRSSRFFIHGLQRVKDMDVTTFEVAAVNMGNEKGDGATVQIQWPDNSIPKANFTANKTIAAPGQEIGFTNKSNAVSETYRWEFKGADIETSTEVNPVITYSEEGEYTVKLVAVNDSGEDEKVMENLITITKAAANGLKNLSQGKNAEASSYVNEAEAPAFAVDGKYDTKWCAVGPQQHTITIDLGSNKTVGEVAVAHAQAGGESDGMNTEEYTIELSEDGVQYVTAAEVVKNSQANTTDAFKKMQARYVRLTIQKATQGSDSAARIYEIEVFGLD